LRYTPRIVSACSWGCGVVSLLALQAAVQHWRDHLATAEQRATMPFISYGGSNLVTCMFGVGLLLNIYRQAFSSRRLKKHATMHARITPRIENEVINFGEFSAATKTRNL